MSVSYMKFIRKGSGRPFRSDQFHEKDLERGALPGFSPHLTHDNVKVLVRRAEGGAVRSLQNCSGTIYHGYVAGLDAQGRPSFLTVESLEDPADYWSWGVSVERETSEVEGRVDGMTLAQSEEFLADYATERYVAQWSLVEKGKRRFARSDLPALYERSATYRFATYRSMGVYHLCLGDTFDVDAPVSV